MRATPSGDFTVKRASLREDGFAYDTYRLSGWLDGRRIIRQFKSREEADGEKNRLEVQAANSDNAVRAAVTRLTNEQIVEAESAFARLTGRSLSAAVDW